MGSKSKPIMHLIILLCGLFMHLISSHPYSFPATDTQTCAANEPQGSGKEDEDIFKFRQFFKRSVGSNKQIKVLTLMLGRSMCVI